MFMVQAMMKCKCNHSQDGASFTTTNTSRFYKWWLSCIVVIMRGTNLGTNGFLYNAGEIWWKIRIYSPFDSAKNTVALSKFAIYQTSGIFASQTTISNDRLLELMDYDSKLVVTYMQR